MRQCVLALTLAAVLACAGSPHDEWRSAVASAPAALTTPPVARVLVFSDFGHQQSDEQTEVAEAILKEHRRQPFDLALDIGDNMGRCGPDPRRGGLGCRFAPDGNTVETPPPHRTDPHFRYLFERPLHELDIAGQPVPVYVALGNHDVNSHGECHLTGEPIWKEERLKACAEVGHRSRHWVMPGRHYVVDRAPARFIVIDGNLLGGNYGGFSFEDELRFVQEASAGCDTRYCFIVSHYGPATVGRRARRMTPAYLARVAQLEAAVQGGLTGWLGGHYHQQHHLRAPAGYDVFVAASTSASGVLQYQRPFPAGTELRYAGDDWGFGVLEVTSDGWGFTFLDRAGGQLYCCRAVGSARCEPAPCPALQPAAN